MKHAISRTVLLVEDQKDLAQTIADYLMADGYEICICHTGNEAIEQYKKSKPDLIILDIMLPDIDGIQLLNKIRSESKIPILMLSARTNDVDKILALGLGADDYMTKPFSPGEMVARVRAQIRRYTEFSSEQTGEIHSGELRFGDIIINPDSYTVMINGQDAGLVAKEFELLYFLAKNKGRVFTREQLFDQIWGYDSFGDINTVTVHIRRIRQKIEKDPTQNQHIKTVWGVGYKFDG